MRVIGLDPGSNVTGYAVIDAEASGYKLVEAGTIKLGSGPIHKRLRVLRTDLLGIMGRLFPSHAAVESPYCGKFLNAVIPLSNARGVILEVVADLPVCDVAPAQTKQVVKANCRAKDSKEQVQAGVAMLLGLTVLPGPDAADAMAIGLAGLVRFQGGTSTSPPKTARSRTSPGRPGLKGRSRGSLRRLP